MEEGEVGEGVEGEGGDGGGEGRNYNYSHSRYTDMRPMMENLIVKISKK